MCLTDGKCCLRWMKAGRKRWQQQTRYLRRVSWSDWQLRHCIPADCRCRASSIVQRSRLLLLPLLRRNCPSFASRPGSNIAYHDVGDSCAAPFRRGVAYIVWPSVLAWSALAVAEPIRWAGIVVSCAGAIGEIWAAISLGVGYSPL